LQRRGGDADAGRGQDRTAEQRRRLVEAERDGDAIPEDERQDDAPDRREEGRRAHPAHRRDVRLESGGPEDREGAELGDRADRRAVGDESEEAGADNQAGADLPHDAREVRCVREGRAELRGDEDEGEGQNEVGQ
jgi:hypothetical protein